MKYFPPALRRRLTYLLLAILPACGDPIGPPAPVASVKLSNETSTVVPGGKTALVATPQDAQGKPLSNRTIAWTTSNPAVATVSAGSVTGVAAGTATITATAEGIAASTEITVKDGIAFGPQGSIFSVLGGLVTVSVPVGAVTTQGQLVIDLAVVSGTVPRLVPGTSYTFTQIGTLNLPVSIGLKYDQTKLANPAGESGLKIYRLTGDKWDRVSGSTVDIANRRVTASVQTFGTFAAFEPAPAAASVNAGNAQTATVGAAVAIAPSIKVIDTEGFPVPNVPVVFAVATGGGSVTGGTAVTNDQGIASATTWKLGTQSGTNTLTATVTGASGGPFTFSATGVAGPASKLTFATAPPTLVQNKVVFPVSPAVQISDEFGNALLVPGAAITVALTSGSGTLDGTKTQITSAAGVATFNDLMFSGNSGQKGITFTSGTFAPLSAVVNLTGGVGAAVSIIAGNNQSAVAGSAVAVAPAVGVTDAAGTPVAGITVTFTVTSGGGTTTGAQAVTDNDGIARVGSWTLGTTAGTNTLRAVAGGLADNPITFSATGIPGTPASISLVSGANQSAPAGRGPRDLVLFRVFDANGNGVPNVNVGFAVTAGGGTVTSTAQTLSTGVAIVRGWTFGPTPGTQSLQATVVNQPSLTASVNATAVTLRIVTFGDSNTDYGYAGTGLVSVSYVSENPGRPDPFAPNSNTTLAGKIEVLWRTAYSPAVSAVNHGVAATSTGSARSTSGGPSARTEVNGVTRFGAEALGVGYPWHGGEPVNSKYNGPITRVKSFTPTRNDFVYISMGSNDQVFLIPGTGTVDNLAFMIDYWTGLGYAADHVILTTLAPLQTSYSGPMPELNRMIRQLATSKGVNLVDIASFTSNDDGLTWKNASLHVGDETHYTEPVKDWIAGKVFDILTSVTASLQQ